ncbi:DUF6588 family protein [candidate division KSB1 bacterium]
MYKNKHFRLIHFITILCLTILFCFSSAFAQEEDDLNETLKKLSGDAAKSYVGPMGSAFGADLNGGWFHKAPPAKLFGFNFEVGLAVMGAFIPDAEKTFVTSGDFRFNRVQAEELTEFIYTDPQYTYLTTTQKQELQDLVIDEMITQDFSVGISGPTIVGKKDENIKVEFSGDDFTVTDPSTQMQINVDVPAEEIELPVGGLLDDIALLPLAAPQFSIGRIYGTRFTLRYLPSMEINEELGKIDYIGFGLQHNPGVWLKNPLPIDLALCYYTQTLKVGDVFEAKSTAFGINFSKQLGLRMLNITPYGGFMFVSSKMSVSYDYNIDTPTGSSTQRIDFELEGENKTRFTFGIGIRLLTFNLNADYNISKFNSVSAGLFFAF